MKTRVFLISLMVWALLLPLCGDADAAYAQSMEAKQGGTSVVPGLSGGGVSAGRPAAAQAAAATTNSNASLPRTGGAVTGSISGLNIDGSVGATAAIRYPQITDCFHNKVINPMCQIEGLDGQLHYVFGPPMSDLIGRINAVVAAGYSSNVTIQAPPDTYLIGSVSMPIQSLLNFTIDLTGSILHPTVANFTPFHTGNALSTNVRLVGGRFLPDATWQLNVRGTGTDLIGYTKVSQ